jgi:mono/diheme cytochrome c family protein
MKSLRFGFGLFSGWMLGGLCWGAATANGPSTKFFEERVAPVLAEKCVKCHSAADGKVKGGLALETREGLKKGGDNGPVIVAGSPEKSVLMQRILSKDPDEKMPPKDDNLTPQQVQDVMAWIRAGAVDPRTAPTKAPSLSETASKAKAHWAFQPIQKPMTPPVSDKAWVRTSIDAYVLALLERNGMKPNAIADKPTLIRRAYFDLIGLPPMPWEVKAFMDDESPNAWEKVIDRLLAMPQYGERWGRYWLDVARYSDTKGDVGKKGDARSVDAWNYRDYVISAFNADRPYDAFIKEQIAADKFASKSAKSDLRPLAALGFLTVGERYKGNENDIINDRIDVVTKGFLGLTVSCARCHDHMFDPIPQKDYYALHGIFASTTEPKQGPVIEARGTPEEQRDYQTKKADVLARAQDAIATELEGVRTLFRKDAGAALMSMERGNGKKGGAALAGSQKLSKDEQQELREMFKGIRAEGAFEPFFAMGNIPRKDFAAKAPDVARRVAAGEGTFSDVPSSVRERFRGLKPSSMEEVAKVYTTLFHKVGEEIASLRKSSGKTWHAVARQNGSSVVRELMDLPGGRLSGGLSLDAIAEALPRKAQGRIRAFLAEEDRIDFSHPGAPRRAMTLEDSAKPKDSPLFIRGEANQKGDIVPRRFLEILSGPNRATFKDGSGRRELAEAIASPANPLTPRVMMNRVWMHHFGQGFVATPDDLGTQAGKAVNQPLLDFLAYEFVRGGWRLKPVHKAIMMSSVYMQGSETNVANAEKDPANRALWRYNVRRLDFEAMRDSLLYISGKLDMAEIGGHPVNIVEEPFSNRRSVYGYIDRSNLPETLAHFDFASPTQPIGSRHETVVPQQALFLMNNPLLVEVSRRLMTREEMKPADTDEKKIHALYWMIFQRPPKAEEIALGMGYVSSVRSVGSGDDEGPVASAGSSTAPAKAKGGAKKAGFTLRNEGERVDRSKSLSEWEKLAHALLMANETVYFN